MRPTTAANASEALDTLRARRYDLAVVDVVMPGRDGLWLATEMQRDYPDTAVIISTAYTELISTATSRPDMADLLVKPFERDRFKLALERGRQWHKQALEELQWHAVLAKELRERTEELCTALTAGAHEPADEWLTAVMAERAPDVLRHCNRVARHTAAVGREMSLDEAAIDRLELASRLHDVGKVAMPEALLTKPSALAPGEAAIMERHVVAGAEILACAPTLAPIARIFLASHEWFDGRGCPGRQAGEAIPLASRIIGVIDAYDLMTETGGDRRPVDRAGAMEALLRASGTQFDPAALAAFLRLLKNTEELGTRDWGFKG